MKIIATDLDGTLFYPMDKKNMIYQPNLYLLQDFIDQGNHVVLVSGRSVSYLKKVIKVIGRDCTMIGYNGACVVDGDEVITNKIIDNASAKQLIDETYQTFKNEGVFIMTEKGVFVHLRFKSNLIRKLAIKYYQGQKIYAEVFSPYEEDYLKELANGKIYKIMLFFGLTKSGSRKADQANKILRNSYDDYECAWSGPVIEITQKGCFKSNALEAYCADKNISKEDVYVVGDSGNDISMFKNFHENSFCMAHGPASVKKYAKYTIDKFEDLSRYILKK